MVMNAPESATVEETARRWVIRVHDASFADWDGLTEWLEQDPAHLAAYDAAVDDDHWAEEVLRSAPPPVALGGRPRTHRRWALVGGTAAAAALAVVGAWVTLFPADHKQEIATGPGQHRTFALADGSTVILNASTRLTFDASKPRAVTLVAGEALFTIRHNARDPFVVTAGGTRLVDAGTVFDVVHDHDALEVAVAQGAVVYAPGKDNIRLDAGANLTRPTATAKPRLGKVSPDGIGGWRTGHLQYDDVSLDRVARDLSRNIGEPIRIPDIAGRMRFSGTLMLADSPERTLDRAGPLLGVRFTRGKDGWAMAAADADR
jgi:transmembrane sensor